MNFPSPVARMSDSNKANFEGENDVGGRCRSVYFTAQRTVEVRTESLNQPEEGEVIVESKLIGISHGTELLVYRGEIPTDFPADECLPSLPGSFSFPIKYGYCNVGQIETGRVFAFAPHQDRFVCQRSDLVPLPPDLSVDDAVFIPNMETALSIVHDTGPLPGEVIAIIGGGIVGQLVLEILRRSFYGKIVMVEPKANRRTLAEMAGAISFDPGDPGLHQWIETNTGDRGVDRVIEISGNPTGMQLAIDLVSYSGLLVEASWFGTKPVCLDLAAYHRKRIEIRCSQVSTVRPGLRGRWNNKRRINVALSLLADIGPGKLISHRFPLDQADRAFALLDSGDEEALQIVLEPQ